MKIRFIGRGSYYAHPFLFTEKNREIEVDKELGEYLLGKYVFEEVKDSKEKIKVKTQREVEEETSEEKKKYEKSKASKKK